MLSEDQRHPVMCLTRDDPARSHLTQVRELCAVGVKWIQLRMKTGNEAERFAIASAVVAECRRHGALCIINDCLDLALAVDADGVHLGRKDGDWRDARAALGPEKILGGTVNNADDAQAVLHAGCLDYVGVGPWRFTHTKQNLAPLLGPAGARELIRQLDGIPAWVIGGIVAEDVPVAQEIGATGVAVSTALIRTGDLRADYLAIANAWMSLSR